MVGHERDRVGVIVYLVNVVGQAGLEDEGPAAVDAGWRLMRSMNVRVHYGSFNFLVLKSLSLKLGRFRYSVNVRVNGGSF